MTNHPAAEILPSAEPPNVTPEISEDSYESIVASLPTRSPIFLPTEKMSLHARIEGVRKVKQIYADRLNAVYRPALRALREKYVGTERCFVIGNGPSINKTDLAALKDEVTFAVNGFFLKTRELDWTPTFYVVEDHLVAEDRREWINAFNGPIKLFPVYLGYCLDEAEDTIFFNHQPRVSYPNGFDFSTDASEITYTGCTVTFTCLQLAHYLGFKEIYLIGVDADYEIPADAQSQACYGVGVLDMKSDDPNHFDPNYFGKGFRWHDPQVDKMVDAYEEAERVTRGKEQRIFNAGIGGKLEVFERRAFSSLFPNARSPEEMERLSQDQRKNQVRHADPSTEVAFTRSAPRLLLFDMTTIGDGTATGEIKSQLLFGWPRENVFHVISRGENQIGISTQNDSNGLYRNNIDPVGLPELIEGFSPDLVLYRPVSDNAVLHQAAMEYIRHHDTPLVTWIMDDWPERLSHQDRETYRKLDADLKFLLSRSDQRLSICDAMSGVFEKRYGLPFSAVSNGVAPEDWSTPKARPPGKFVVRYAGSLAEDMTLESVVRVAEAVEQLASEGLDIQFEIKTRKIWEQLSGANFQRLTHTRINTNDLTPKQYRDFLSESDVVLIAYNFDPLSTTYVQYSLANKLPECLASGAVVLAHGPAGLATIDVVQNLSATTAITEPDIEQLKDTLKRLSNSPFERYDIARKMQAVAFQDFNLHTKRAKLRALLLTAANDAIENQALPYYPRATHAHVDETNVLATMLKNRRGQSHVMLDVGAHNGASAQYFHNLDWTIKCFEPDAANRKHLDARFKKAENITIDSRAVSNKPATGVAFFTSGESTGISSLHAFRDSHEETSSVNVTTVSEIVRDHGIHHVDFLKIDVEGFDFNVLKGVPWETIRPDVIEAEFEDAKTLSLGHSYKDIADYLVELGYTVYLSEWHPIIRYGIRHDWRQVIRYPDKLMSENAWGNILAFHEDPGIDAVRAAFKVSMNVESKDMGNTVGESRPVKNTHKAGNYVNSDQNTKPVINDTSLPLYTRFALWAQQNHSPVFAAGQFVMWLARSAKRYPGFSVGYLLALCVLLALPLSPVLQPYSMFFRGVAAVLGALGLAVVIAGYAGHILKRQRTERATQIRSLQTQIVSLQSDLSHTNSTISTIKQSAPPALNFARFQTFNRTLTDDQLEALQNQWSKRLGLDVSERSLAYLAHRACVLESQMHGRLATSIENIVLRTLVALAVKRSDISILEIGTLFGTGAGIIYDAIRFHYKQRSLTLLDPLEGYYGGENNDILTAEPVNERLLSHNLSVAGIDREDVHLIKKLSTDPEAIAMAGDRQYDVLIIDGDHSYEGVKFDYENYREFVRVGGYLIFDDYGAPDWPEVTDYVNKEVMGTDGLEYLGAEFRSAIFRVM